MKQAELHKSRKKGQLPSRRPREGKRALSRENLVAEIVDQITEKQSRAAHQEQVQRSAAENCTFCLEQAVAESAYRLVLKCEAGENPPSDP